jgi:CDGSH-type Zn-finger protein
MSEDPENANSAPKIVIMPNGSYHVLGNIALVHKTQVVSEYGEPLTWQKDKEYQARNIPGRDFYGLCRCGKSKNKPFCDGTHFHSPYDGTETADTGAMEKPVMVYPYSTGIIVMKDPSICMNSGYCGMHDANMNQLVAGTDDTKIRALVMAMVERCPSGALTYRIEKQGPDIEPDLPVQIAATTEMTSEGPIEGPLWVTGNITVERADGQLFEPRNRVTLCNCGQSCQKPLCDGTHREIQERALRQKNAETL